MFYIRKIAKEFSKKNCAYILHELKADNNTFRDIKRQNKLPKGFVIIFYKKNQINKKT